MEKPVAYAYAGVAHCPDCAAADFRNGLLVEDTTYPGEFPADEHGLPMLLIGPRGDLVSPLFAAFLARAGREVSCDRCRRVVTRGRVPA